MAEIISIQTFIWAILGGVIPALAWLLFWLSKDSENPEPIKLIVTTFIAGALSVFLAIFIQEQIPLIIELGEKMTILANAFTEEIVKFFIVVVLIFGSKHLDEPIDYAIYMITGAIGFSALENTLFLIEPLQQANIGLTFTTGNLRFLGASALHALTGSVVGIFLAFSFHKNLFQTIFLSAVGILTATTLHIIFNLLIINTNTSDIKILFGILWGILLIIYILLEKIKLLKTS